MEILRNKDNIRMVLNENLINPDSKRLRLVKTRIKLMNEVKKKSHSMSAKMMPGGVNADQFGLTTPLTFGGCDSYGAQNSVLDSIDHTKIPDRSKESMLVDGESRDASKAGCSNDASENGIVSNLAVFPPFQELQDEESQVLKRIKSELEDCQCFSVDKEKCSWTKDYQADQGDGCDVVNLSTHTENRRLESPNQHTHINLSGDRNSNDTPDSSESKISNEVCKQSEFDATEKLRLIASCKGKTQSQLAQEFGITELEVFETLRDRDEIEMQFRYQLMRKLEPWQQQFVNPCGNNMPPFVNFEIDSQNRHLGDQTGDSLRLVKDRASATEGCIASHAMEGNKEQSKQDGKGKRKRRAISLEDKMVILQNKGQKSLRETADTFGVGKTTVLDIFRRAEEITSAFQDKSLNPKRKKLRSWKNTEINYEMVDMAVFDWYNKISSQPGVCVCIRNYCGI